MVVKDSYVSPIFLLQFAPFLKILFWISRIFPIFHIRMKDALWLESVIVTVL